MTKGFTRPFTPNGTASIMPALPWRFAGNLLLIHFRTDPKALADLIPEPLQPHANHDEAFLWSPVLNCHPVEQSSAHMDPARSFYNVAVIGIPARFNGENTMLSAFQWCDRDWLVLLSWFMGTCSKLAHIEQTGMHPLFGKVGSDQGGGVGSTLNRTVSRNGDKIIKMSLKFEREISIDDMQFYFRHLPLTSMRHIPDCHVPARGRPDLHDLTQMVMSDTAFGTPLSGSAHLEFGDSDNEDLLPLQPKEVLGGYWIPMAFNLDGIKVVHNYLD